MAINLNNTHRFLDEAGDTTFYLKGKKNAIGKEGVSACFILGMVKINDSLAETKDKIINLQNSIANDSFLNVIPSVRNRICANGYYLHAKDDPPEIKMLAVKLIQEIDCSFEAVVLIKSLERFETRHKGKEEYVYADALSHLLKNKFQSLDKLVLNIAERGKCTKNSNLDIALKKARLRFKEKHGDKPIKTAVVFNISNPIKEPLLNIADYFCWTVQRVFEKGDTRYYDYLKNQISTVADIYDFEKSKDNWGNYYSPKNPLTLQNKICPQ